MTTYKDDLVIHAGASIFIPSKVDGFVTDKSTPCVFAPECYRRLGDNLKIHEAVLMVKKGSKRVFITITNESFRDIKLQGSYRLGHLHLISFITPAEEKREDLTVSDDKKDIKEDIMQTLI